MTEPRYRLPNEVATQLQISPSTLRRWSNEFADSLSETAGRPQAEEGGQAAHRRYTDEDLETLMTIKGLLAEGLTYIQVGRRLEALRFRQTAEGELADEDGSQFAIMDPALDQRSTVFPAVTILADTLHTVADGQQMLLGSQQANRDLLSVVLQDNFNLKEENAKLRDRMLELERDLAEMQRLEGTRRDAIDARFRDLEQQIRQQRVPVQRVQPTEPKAQSQRSGCLSQIFGPIG